VKGSTLALGLLLAVGFSVVSAASARPTVTGGVPATSLRQLQGVNFIGSCRFSHEATDDPIVFPGQPGKSHDHSFVGNVSTNAFSTLRSLRAAGTTCRRNGETAAYWMPTLLQNGQPVLPRGATIYYRRHSLAPIQSFPQGLEIVAGNSHATTPQGRRVTFWNCGADAGIAPSSTVPTCPAGAMLRLHVMFPDCWNGTTLDSPDHASHMAYSVRGQCPASHPVAVPAIALIYRYPITGGENVTLASGGQLSGHGDFFNAWRPGALQSLVSRCLNQLRMCRQGR
jgi:uncharacterized protein DUF1996